MKASQSAVIIPKVGNRESLQLAHSYHQNGKDRLKFNVLWSRLIIKQVKQSLPIFLDFSSFTDSNLFFFPHSTILDIFTVFAHFIIILFSFFTNFPEVWKYSESLQKFSKTATSIFNIPTTIPPSDIFSQPSLYITIFFGVYSIFFYIYVYLHKTKKSIAIQKLTDALLTISQGISFILLLYELSNISVSLMQFFTSNNYDRSLYLIEPAICLFSLPSAFIPIIRSIIIIDISSFPYLSSDPSKSFIQLLNTAIICSIIPLFGNIKNTSIYYRTWLLVIVLLISFRNIYNSYHYPSFLRPITQILIFASNLVLPINTIIAYFIALSESPPKYLALILFSIVNVICPILSFLFYRVRANYYKDILFKNQTNISELDEETIFKIYTYSNRATLPLLTSIDFAQQVNENFPFSDRCLILSLRFLFSTKKHPDYIFQRSAFLFRSSMGNSFSIFHLAMLIELSNELLLQNVFQTTIRLNKLDRIISECCDAHVFFWNSVLIDDLAIISDCSFLLYNSILRASNYFQYLNSDVKLSNEYKKRFSHFNQFISINLLSADQNNGITPSPSLGTWKPSRIKESKSAHITFQDSTEKDLLLVEEGKEKPEEKASTPKKITFIRQNQSIDTISHNLLYDNMENDSDFSTSRFSRTESNTRPVYRNIGFQIRPQKVQIAEQIKDFTLPGQKLRNNLLIFFMIINFLVYLVFAVACFVMWIHMSRFWVQSNSYYDLNFVLYNTSYQLLFSLVNDASKIVFDYLFLGDQKSPFSINSTEVISMIENSKRIYRSNSIKLSNESLPDLLFDSYLSTMHSHFSTFDDFLTSDNFLNNTDLLTQTSIDLLYQDFNQTDDLLGDENHAYYMMTRFHFYSILLNIILFPFFTYVCVKTYKDHSKIFWQPLLLNKLEVKKAFQYFTNECLKQSTVSNKINIEKKKKKIKQRRFDYHLTIIILLLFAVYLIPLALTNFHIVIASLLFKTYANMLKCIHYTTYTCIPYISSIYQLFVASKYPSSVQYQAYQSLVSNLLIISHFIRQSNNSYSIAGKQNYNVGSLGTDEEHLFCYSSLFDLNISNQPSLYELSSIDIGDTMLSLKFFASLRLLHFNLIQNIRFSCIHPENHSSIMELIHEWLSVGPIFHKYYEAVSFNFNKDAIQIQITGFISFFVIGIIQIILLIYGFKKIDYLKDFVRFITRLLAIIPNESPLVNPETNTFHYFEKMPKMDMMPVLDRLPVAFVAVDHENKVVESNQMAKDIFAGMVNHGNHFKPLSELIDQNGIMHFFKVISSLMKNFPFHPYLRNIDGAAKFYIFQDISSVKNKISHIRMLTYDLVNFRKSILQPTITPKLDVPDPVLFLDQIAIVEIVFPEDMSQDLFFTFLIKTIETANKYSTVFLHDTKRSTYLLVFSSFNQHVKLMQHYRDAIKCAQYLYDYFCSICGNQSRIKIAVCQSDRSICRIIDSKIVKVELFSSVLMKSAMLLKFANQGDIIVESEVLRSIVDFVSSHMMHGTLVFEDQQINYCVITNGLSFRETIIDF